MKGCPTCGKAIYGGGFPGSGLVYCSGRCQQKDPLVPYLGRVAPAEAAKVASQVHAVGCPLCGEGDGVDVRYTAFCVSGGLVFFSSCRGRLCCRSCNRARLILHTITTFLFGWWSPWGLYSTPIQLTRNLREMGRSAKGASADLRAWVRRELALSYAPEDVAKRLRKTKVDFGSGGLTVRRGV